MSHPTQFSLQRLIIVLGLAIGLGVAQIWLWEYVQRSAEALHTKRIQTAQRQDIRERLTAIDQVYQKQSQLLEQLSVVFPRHSDTPQIIERLEQLALDRRLTIVVRSIGEVAPENNNKVRILPLPAVVHVTGSLPALISYLEAVEHVQELTGVTSWSLMPDPAGWAMDLEVVFYIQPS